MKSNQLIVVSVLVSVLVGGCATVGPGSTQSATPPQIVTDAQKRNVWDNPSAFGPVPANLQAKGDALCKASGFKKKATGYHLHAKQLDGKEFVGGGFFCPADDN